MHLRARCKLNYFVAAGERAEAHYNKHLIRVTALRIPGTTLWRFSAIIIWRQQTLERAKLFLQDQQEFTSANDAVRCGLELATDWIRAGKREQPYL
jgi:hypothetical protein